MTETCPNCAGEVGPDAEFCPTCGESLTTTCDNCGADLPAAANFCADCGLDLTAGGEPAGSSGDATDGAWRLGADEFARRVDGAALDRDGLLAALTRRKEIRIEAGNRALVLEDGALVEELGPGRHTLDGLGSRLRDRALSRRLTVVLVEAASTTVTLPFERLRTADDDLVTVTLELSVRVADAETFFEATMGDRAELTTGAVRGDLGRALRDEVEAVVADRETDDLYGARAAKADLLEELSARCGPALDRRGLGLVDLLSLGADDGRGAVREARRDVAVDEEAASVRERREELADETAALDRRQRERETDDEVHATRESVRREAAERAGEHELDRQTVEQAHELEDAERRHEQAAEREAVDHEQRVERRRTEGAVDRRALEHEQDVDEVTDLIDLKARKDDRELDRARREQDLAERRADHEVEVERERLAARDDVDATTLASLAETDAEMAELARMEQAGELTPDQIEALGARDSDALARAREAAKAAEQERERAADQEAFREELRAALSESMDRVERTSETAMETASEAAQAAAEDTADNVILRDSETASGGDTTIVQGSGGNSGDDGTTEADEAAAETEPCPECGAAAAADSAFCTACGADL